MAKDKQTTKDGEVTDKGPHGRDWEPQEEFIADTGDTGPPNRLFPKEWGAGLEQGLSGVPRPALWAFAFGTMGLSIGLAIVLYKRLNAPKQSGQAEKVVH